MKTTDEVSMTYIKEILPKMPRPKLILKDNGTEFRNKQLMSVFNSLGIKIYRQPILPTGNSRVKNMHNFLKQMIANIIWHMAISLSGMMHNH